MSLLFSSLICYLIAIILSIVISLIIGLPLIGEKPIRYSWTSSAVFPTPIIAIGLLALCFSINFYWLYDGIVLAIICGVISPIIVRFLFDYIFPKPPGVD
ncbi:MAG: energy-converting hydrogenase A subunit A EhaA [Methanobrevibacter sp.]|nr:energy-converting hydrogenase A subunit A EhaA [Candidatus Methanoflexus mossambicus]